MVNYLKNMFGKENIIFMVVSIIASIIILNLYAKLLSTPIEGWMALVVVVTVTIFGIFISGWLLGLRWKRMHLIEFGLTILLIVLIMVAIDKFFPNVLYSATNFVTPSREFLVDGSRGVFGQ